MFLQARLLVAKKLTQRHLNDASFDVVMSMADIEFPHSFHTLLPSFDGLKEIAKKCRHAAELLPQSLRYCRHCP
eukprot:scaffold1803_cov92-Amphora_coffeaeformis.AAC.26